MGQRGRPPLQDRPVEVFIHLRLYPGIDDDLIGRIQSTETGRLSTLLKQWLREGARSGPDGGAGEQDERLSDLLEDMTF